MSNPENQTENNPLRDDSLRAPVVRPDPPRTPGDEPPTEGATPDLPLSSPD